MKNNDLSGELPSGFPEGLLFLRVSDNPRLSGKLPLEPYGSYLACALLDIKNTGICVPGTTEFDEWLMDIVFFIGSGITCGEESEKLI